MSLDDGGYFQFNVCYKYIKSLIICHLLVI